MRGLLHRVRAALVGLGLLASTAAFVWSAPTVAQAAGCTAPQVAVLVELSHWGGSDRVGCVGWTSSLTGYQALHTAGFSTTGTVHDGPAFVCRIENYPTVGAPDHEACVSTPPATKFWSYWHAAPGQSSWTFSTLGTASYHPHAGSVDAWTFGAGAAPSVAPVAVMPGAASVPTRPAPSTPTVPASTHRSTGRSSAPTHHSAPTKRNVESTRSTGAGSTASGAPTPSGATSPSGAASASSGATARAGTTPAATGSSTPSRSGGVTIAAGRAPAIVANRSSGAASSTKASGSPGPTIAGVLVVAALAAGGGFYAWRRRESRSHAG